jgi:hypothetical protein
MFNNYSYKGGNTTTNINAVTGAILKNHPKSWFECFHLNGKRANRLLTEGGDKGKRQDYSYDNVWQHKPITVLQMVICGDMQVVAECVYTEDLEQKVEIKE